MENQTAVLGDGGRSHDLLGGILLLPKRFTYSIGFLLLLAAAVAMSISLMDVLLTSIIRIENESDGSVIVNFEQTSALDVLVAGSTSRTVRLRDLPRGTIVSVEDVETGEMAEGWIDLDLDDSDSQRTLRVLRDSRDRLDWRWAE
ncbi:hypothetical protein K239x_24520 [Planctomycetes bacterium K23_9]|uniref:Uncharacterized protein n=1 Tax=Stieleria marina TaxID=1930275 RepID=A0A517NTP8_9BACT|nr:hypothetical protein K239x_24520 [Planctomycetes bacterium K23_9]